MKVIPSPPEGTKKFEFVVFLQGAPVPSGRPFLLRGQKSLLNTLKCVEFYGHYEIAVMFVLAFIFLKLSPILQ